MFRRWRTGTVWLNLLVSEFCLQCSFQVAVDLKTRLGSLCTFISCFRVWSSFFHCSSFFNVCCFRSDSWRATNNWSCSLKQKIHHKVVTSVTVEEPKLSLSVTNGKQCYSSTWNLLQYCAHLSRSSVAWSLLYAGKCFLNTSVFNIWKTTGKQRWLW